MTTLIQWLSMYRFEIALLSAISMVLLCVTVFATPWLLAKLPADYFCRKSVQPTRTLRSISANFVRNVLGACFLLLGLILMVTPGPGLVCLVVGLALCNFPGKTWLMAKLVTHPNVFSTLNWARRKANAEPFLSPKSC